MLGHAGRRGRVAAAHLGTQVERGVPEHVPLVGIDDVLRELHAQIPQRTELLVADPPQALGDLEFDSCIGCDGHPRLALVADCQLINDWCAVDDAEPKSQPLVFGTWPLDKQHVAQHVRCDAADRCVGREVTNERGSRNGGLGERRHTGRSEQGDGQNDRPFLERRPRPSRRDSWYAGRSN